MQGSDRRPFTSSIRIAAVVLLTIAAVVVWRMQRAPHDTTVRKSESRAASVDSGTVTISDSAYVIPSERASASQAESIVDGILRVLGEEDEAAIDGEMTITAIHGGDRRELSAVQVRDGRWSADVPHASHVVVTSMQINKKKAWPTSAVFVAPSSGPIVLEAAYSLQYGIRIVDAVTDVDLSDITVAEQTAVVEEFDTAIRAHPGRSPSKGYAMTDSLESPLRYPALRKGSYLVTAPGYVWERLWLSGDLPSQHEVRLAKSGALSARIDGRCSSLTTSSPWILLTHAREAGDEPRTSYAFPLDDCSPWVLDKLHPGKYQLAIALAGWGRKHTNVASIEVVIREGATTDAVLRIPNSIGDVEPCAVDGIVHGVDTGVVPWPRSVRFERLIDGSPVRNAARVTVSRDKHTLREERGVCAWNPIPLMPGDYMVQLEPYGVTHLVTVPKSPTWTMELFAPVATRMSVRVIDRDSGADLELEYFLVASASDSLTAKSALPGGHPTTGPFSNPIELNVRGDFLVLRLAASDHGPRRVVLDRHDGDVQTVALARNARTRVQARLFGAERPMPSNWWSSVSVTPSEASTGEYVGLTQSKEGDFVGGVSTVEMRMTAPGSYAIQFASPIADRSEAVEFVIDVPRPPSVGSAVIDLTPYYLSPD